MRATKQEREWRKLSPKKTPCYKEHSLMEGDGKNATILESGKGKTPPAFLGEREKKSRNKGGKGKGAN